MKVDKIVVAFLFGKIHDGFVFSDLKNHKQSLYKIGKKFWPYWVGGVCQCGVVSFLPIESLAKKLGIKESGMTPPILGIEASFFFNQKTEFICNVLILAE